MSQPKAKCQNCPALSSSCFAGASEETLTKVDQLVTKVELASGQEFTFEIDGQSGCGCVHSGHLKVQTELQGEERAVRIAKPGSLIGLRNWFSESKYSSVALEASEVCFFANGDFEELRRESKEVTENLIKSLCETLRASDQYLASLESLSLRSRVALTLLRLFHKMGSKQHLNIDRVTIAQLAGTVPESLARILTEFESEKMIERRGRSLYIENVAALENVAADSPR